MATIQAWGSINGNYRFELIVTPGTQNIANNYTATSWELKLISSGGYSFSTVGSTVVINVDGEVFNAYSQKSISANSSITIASGSKNIYHGADGNKKVNFSFNYSQTATANYTPGNCSASGSVDLKQIPREAKITAFSITSKTLTGFNLSYSADSAVDYVQHRINGGAWKDGTAVTGLNPNTSYTLRIRVKRTDSQLWTESWDISGTTHDIAKFSNLANINFGDTANVVVTNPSGVRNDLAIKIGATIVATRTSIVLNNTITFSQAELDTIYSLMTNNMPVTLTYVLSTYNGSVVGWTTSEGKLCTMTGNAKTIKINILDVIKRGIVWLNVSGTNRKGLIWENVAGIWKRGK